MRTAYVLGLTLIAFAGYRFLSVPTKSLPESSIVSEAVDQRSPQYIVETLLKNNRIVIFSKSYCGYSMRAKSVFDRLMGPHGAFHVVELDKREDGADIQDYLYTVTGGRTVPRVFIDAEFIGGSDETATLDASGQLAALLKAKGIMS